MSPCTPIQQLDTSYGNQIVCTDQSDSQLNDSVTLEEDPSTHYCRGNYYYDNETGPVILLQVINGTYASTTATAISDNVCTSINAFSTTGYTITDLIHFMIYF